MKFLPKLLRKIDTGRIFPYNPILAKRSDMVPVWEGGVDPNGGPKLTGLQIDSARDAQVNTALQEKDQMIGDLKAQLQAMKLHLNEANDMIRKLNVAANMPAAPKTDQVDASPRENIPMPADRQARMVEGIKRLIGNENNLTGSGKVRIEKLEEACGLEDITADERDAAQDIAAKEIGL